TDNVVWHVILQDKTLGAYELKLSLETPRGELKAGAKEAIELPEIKPLNVFRETGQVAALKDGNLEFSKIDAKSLETIDPKELHGPLQQGGVFLAYKYAAHPVALRIDVAKNMYLDVPNALVTFAILNTVIAEDRAQSTEVIYWLKNNSLPFFSVRLPKGG